jgi:hypothetical protein
MRRRWFVIAPLLVVLAFCGLTISQKRLDSIRQKTFQEDLLYLPNDKLLNHFTAGMSSVIADFLWIRCIDYTVQHFKGDGKFTWLNHMCNVITRLDPNFTSVYRYGGIFLAALKADDDAGIDLLKRGMANNPEAWELPYEIAMTYLLNRRDEPDSQVNAARYLGMAVETGNAPSFVIDVAGTMQVAHNLKDIERSMWEKTRTSGDKFLRDLAERKLMELDLREACDALNKAIAMYSERYGKAPARIEDLVSGGIIERIPKDSLGGSFFIDSEGVAKNTTVQSEQVQRLQNVLNTAIDSYKKMKNAYPPSLDDLVKVHIMDAVPHHPIAGSSWNYNPATGEIN